MNSKKYEKTMESNLHSKDAGKNIMKFTAYPNKL
jgi:hypothetical protein